MLAIKIFERTAQNRSELRLIQDALKPGLSVMGDDVSVSSSIYEPCDVAVVLWSPRSDATDRARAARNVRNLHGRNVLIIETPIFRNLATWHFRVGFDHVHRGGRFFPANCPGDRIGKFGLNLQPWRVGEGPIVIAGQLPGDYSLDGLDCREWVVDVATYLERSVDRPVYIRPHPLDYATDWYPVGASLHMMVSREPLEADLARAGTWIAHTSGSAVDAVLAGIPTICLGPGNFAWDVSAHSLRGLREPWTGDREPWLANLSYAQWTHEEIRDGSCWRTLRGLVDEA